MVTRTTIRTSTWDAIYTYLQTTNAISTNNIYSAFNSQLIKSVGYPIVIINPPSTPLEPISTDGRTTESSVSIGVQIYTLTAATAKSLMDEVCAKLIAGRATFNGVGLKKLRFVSEDYDFWEEGQKTIHRSSFTILFRFVQTN